jgi:hypothetical protein
MLVRIVAFAALFFVWPASADDGQLAAAEAAGDARLPATDFIRNTDTTEPKAAHTAEPKVTAEPKAAQPRPPLSTPDRAAAES